jgi:PAS domain S-box-containing protein
VTHRPSVLLVDDRPENLLALEAVLRGLDAELVAAQSGEDALKALLERDFAAILLDVQMPRMDGFETAQLIRMRERSATTPIIFLTAISKDLEHVARGYEAGAVDYVLKPFDPLILRSKVRVFCDLERHRRARAESDELLRRAFESAPTGMVLVDEDGLVLHCNPAVAAMTGHAVDGPLAAVFSSGDAPRLRALLDHDGREELHVVDARGGEVPVDVVTSGVPDVDGTVRRRLVQLTDLRERRRARQAQQRLVAEQAKRQEAEALAARLAAVAAVTEGLDELSLTTLVPTLCDRLREVLGARGAVVEIIGDDGRVDERAAVGEAVADDLLARASERGALCADAVAGAVAMPLRVDGRALGVVGIAGAPADAHDPQRTGLLRHAGERAALIIERGRLYDRERRIAATLQQDLLPDQLPEVPGVTMAAYLSAGQDGAQVGGDWYDALALPGGRLGIIVGDVAGRGVAAAARMGQLRSVARAYALEGHGPAELAMRLNAYHLALGAETMTTLLYAVVEPDRGRLRFVSAGHLPPLVRLPGEAPRFVSATAGPPLGVLDVCRYREVEVAFPAGSLLALCTDGLVERRGESLDAGLERLRAALELDPVPIDDVERARDRILEACLGSEDGPGDDVTAVVVRAEELLGDEAHVVLTPDADALGALRRLTHRWLAEVGATPQEASEIVMAANEAWQNAIEHGNAFALVPIEIDLVASLGEVRVTVRDLGHDEGRTPDADRGRGLQLMHALVDEARVDLGGPLGGTVVLRRRLASAGVAGATGDRVAART